MSGLTSGPRTPMQPEWCRAHRTRSVDHRAPSGPVVGIRRKARQAGVLSLGPEISSGEPDQTPDRASARLLPTMTTASIARMMTSATRSVATLATVPMTGGPIRPPA